MRRLAQGHVRQTEVETHFEDSLGNDLQALRTLIYLLCAAEVKCQERCGGPGGGQSGSGVAVPGLQQQRSVGPLGRQGGGDSLGVCGRGRHREQREQQDTRTPHPEACA